MTEEYYILKENAIWNLPDELATDTMFACTLDGKTFQCIVCFDAKNICVTISDQKWFQFNHAHIMYMCPKIYTRKNVKGSPASHYGVMRLKNLIVDLYHDNLRVSENLDQIKDCLIEYNHHVESINNRLEALEEEMIATRKANREGKYTQDEYWKLRRSYHSERSQANYQKYQAFEKYFASVIPLFCDREKLYDLIEYEPEKIC